MEVTFVLQDKTARTVDAEPGWKLMEVAVDNAIPGIECRRPSGAFYVFPDIAGTGLSGAELAERLLQEAGVCVLAGSAFGHHGDDHIRISYANSQANLAEALARIRTVVEPLAAARV